MSVPPILLIAFNRPEHTQKVYEELRKARPSKLYIAIDGARKDRIDDVEKIKNTIKIFDSIDWVCDVKKLLRTENLGCKKAVSSAISWFFEQEEQGIILEDDCIPSISFFSYCDHLLRKYKYNDSIMHINGTNFQDGQFRGSGTYYFSRICHVWGWASWRRAWEKYDIEMDQLESFFNDNIYKSIINYPTSYKYWSNALYATKQGQIDTWDYQWVYSIWKNNGLCIAPNYNLVSNIGFDEMATHTKKEDKSYSNKPTSILNGPIKDCNILAPHFNADLYSFNKFFKAESFSKRLMRKVKKTLLLN